MSERTGKTYWFDIPVQNMLDAMSFYEGLFGWKYLKLSEPVLPEYYVILKGDDMIGGLRKSPGENSKKSESDGPILYFTVDLLDPAALRAKELGAKLVGSRVNLGKERGCYQWLRDRENNLIALWAPQ